MAPGTTSFEPGVSRVFAYSSAPTKGGGPLRPLSSTQPMNRRHVADFVAQRQRHPSGEDDDHSMGSNYDMKTGEMGARDTAGASSYAPAAVSTTTSISQTRVPATATLVLPPSAAPPHLPPPPQPTSTTTPTSTSSAAMDGVDSQPVDRGHGHGGGHRSVVRGTAQSLSPPQPPHSYRADPAHASREATPPAVGLSLFTPRSRAALRELTEMDKAGVRDAHRAEELVLQLRQGAQRCVMCVAGCACVYVAGWLAGWLAVLCFWLLRLVLFAPLTSIDPLARLRGGQAE